jgi:hypothetical protein
MRKYLRMLLHTVASVALVQLRQSSDCLGVRCWRSAHTGAAVRQQSRRTDVRSRLCPESPSPLCALSSNSVGPDGPGMQCSKNLSLFRGKKKPHTTPSCNAQRARGLQQLAGAHGGRSYVRQLHGSGRHLQLPAFPRSMPPALASSSSPPFAATSAPARRAATGATATSTRARPPSGDPAELPAPIQSLLATLPPQLPPPILSACRHTCPRQTCLPPANFDMPPCVPLSPPLPLTGAPVCVCARVPGAARL